MTRLLILWLTLLGAFWLTRAAVSALLFQRAADHEAGALLLLIAVPLLQTVAVGWLTRPHSESETASEPAFDPAEGVGVAGPDPDEDAPA
jgi:hypothetical protein